MSGSTAKEGILYMKNSTYSLALAAAVAGLLGGTAVRVHAQPVSPTSTTATAQSAQAGTLLAEGSAPLPKHACKGQNDCKGQGGGKHPGKNSCKGKGGCATDGSKSAKA